MFSKAFVSLAQIRNYYSFLGGRNFKGLIVEVLLSGGVVQWKTGKLLKERERKCEVRNKKKRYRISLSNIQSASSNPVS